MYPRKMLIELKRQARERKISFLLGARQVGKTTLLQALFDDITAKSKGLFLDLDILSNYEKVSSYERLLATLQLQGYQEQQRGFFYLFLDEFQKYPAMAGIMKNIADHHPNVKIYASGSASLMIKDQIQESLAGRKKINEVFPLDFEEFLWFKRKEKLAASLGSLLKMRGENLSSALQEYQEALEEYLIFGGYPEVTLKAGSKEKKEVLESIFDLYVKKDLVEYLRMEKVLQMKKLIEFLAVNNGQKTKYEEITALTGLNFHDIQRYLEILQETYLIQIVRPFYSNKNKELTKIPKIYFLDPGVRNYFINNFNLLSLRQDAGFLFESFILSELKKKGKGEIKFWQDKSGSEVDFVVQEGTNLKALEAKYKTHLKAEDFRGLAAFAETYPKVKEKYLCNLGTQQKEKGIALILPYNIRV